jgi:hypothetical protein
MSPSISVSPLTVQLAKSAAMPSVHHGFPTEWMCHLLIHSMGLVTNIVMTIVVMSCQRLQDAPATDRDYRDWMALQAASGCGHLEIVERLLSASDGIVYACDTGIQL